MSSIQCFILQYNTVSYKVFNIYKKARICQGSKITQVASLASFKPHLSCSLLIQLVDYSSSRW